MGNSARPRVTLQTSDRNPRLEIRHIDRIFGGRKVVDGVTLQVLPGQVTCLLGPSGCGKSTTLRIIAGVDRQDAGEIRIDGQLVCDTVFRLPPERRSVGLMFQDFALFPHLSVAENVAFGLTGPKAARRARVEALLDRVALGRFIDAFPHELSGGEQQRVALARALAPRPKIMLMDEPFSGLDNRLRDEIRDETLQVLKEEGAAVLLVTHEPDEAMRMADEIALMRGGRIVQQGAPYNLYNAPVDRAAAAFFSDINVIRGRVRNLLTETPFGKFLTPGMEDGAEVDIIIRPQHLRIDFDRNGRGPNPTPEEGVAARARVQRARFMGSESLVEFRMDHDGSVLKATVPAVFLPAPGTAMWLTIRRDRCFVFPASGQDGDGRQI
ncbi:Fe3+/spermidine/putrescine ABC transporter ATP-binding protein [Rhodovulum sulfidophilum]|nr:Fe3+/spermidine/putrescine ABC transporter ATP-binding protein [Rhodovulum sulfidophilum]